MVIDMDFEEETRRPRRSLGNGRWDRKLKQRMVDLSEADLYEEANKEWIVTDNVWHIPFGTDASGILPDIHCNGENAHPHECLCGHRIIWHFEIRNTLNGNRQIVGSEHIESYMVVRKLKEQGYTDGQITDKLIDEWIGEKVKTLKAKWWWDLHGKQFEEWFELVKELDLRINVRHTGRYVWDSTTRTNNPVKVIRKRAEGAFGTAGYKMASIVWRWNHPDNSKKQIETRGYPNDRLWNDLQMFAILVERHRATVLAEDTAREQRILKLAEDARKSEIIRKQREIEYQARQVQMKLEQEKRDIRHAEREGAIEEKRLQRIIADRINAHGQNETFINMCEYYDLPVFTVNVATTDWERRFLGDITLRMSNSKHLTSSQLNHLRKIILDTPLPASDKQIWYIKKLAGDDFEIPNALTKTAASDLINTLKGE